MSNIDKQALNQEKIEWLNKLADMEYCKSNPGHWLMSLKDTNMLAQLALHSQALLDELEAKDRLLEDEIGRANREHHRGFMMACGHLKEHSNIHYADAAEMEIAALRKRINELESAAAGKGEES
ncbi:hypothetical protein NR352_23970 [Enterobacter soli]|uniref:hypothetical protein n=1 Tax=Enterobacter soli TaxID=885040 RepID=UPI00214864C1|nr:hypothetical protein [Enterobacter soli]MCR1319986.1 hypothetical protein [Enterobacter soli]